MTPVPDLTLVALATLAGLVVLLAAWLGRRFLLPLAAPLLSVPPDWQAFCERHKLRMSEHRQSLTMRGLIHDQLVELVVPDRGGVLPVELIIATPPTLAHGTKLGPLTVGVDLESGPQVQRWELQLHLAADAVPAQVEAICATLQEAAETRAVELSALAQAHLTPSEATTALSRAKALLAWDPRPDYRPPHPGRVFEVWSREPDPRAQDRVAWTSRSWLLELHLGAAQPFTMSRAGVGSERSGNPVLDMALSLTGSLPPELATPELSEHLMWLLHGHLGELDERRLRVWLEAGELVEGLERGQAVVRRLAR